LPTATETPAPTATATETPKPTPTPGFPIQPRTIDKDEVPEQVFATGAFRYTVEAAVRGPRISEIGLSQVAGIEWVVLVVHVWNWSDEPATLNMSDLQLIVSGPSFGSQFVALDPSTGEIARNFDFDPALDATDVVSIDENDGGRLALVYLVPPDTTAMELIDEASGLDLAISLEQEVDLTNLGKSPRPPEMLEATVIEVLDGRTIVVEADGFEAPVQYTGVNAPGEADCYGAESTQANANLVLGATVYLERQYYNRLRDGTLVRDVWIDNGLGGLVLASAVLASEGTVYPEPREPDLRYASWIGAASLSSQFNGLGLWGACGGPPVAEVLQPFGSIDLDPLAAPVSATRRDEQSRARS
jgi:hypothetical protein